MNELPRWRGDERLARTPLLHLTPGLDGVSRAVNEADRGLLPAEATIALGQPMARRPVARARRLVGDLGAAPGAAAAAEGRRRRRARHVDGGWTEALREAYADRIVERIGRHIENLESATIARVVMSPADMEAANPNWVGGDIYAGSCSLDQNLLFRPTPASPGHGTPVDRLWHIGASTHPGPGLGAGSGYLVAKQLTKPPLARRLLAKVPGPAVTLSLSEISTVARDLPRRPPRLRGRRLRRDRHLGDEARRRRRADLEALRASGLRATNCVPLVPSILPNTVIEGPEDVETRIESLCASMHRFARYEPDCVLCLTGPAGGARRGRGARSLVIDGLRRIAAAADEAGVRLGLEPIHASERDALTLSPRSRRRSSCSTRPSSRRSGLMVDLWHLGDTPEIERHLAENVDRITGVHVAEWFAGPRDDRALPGERCARADARAPRCRLARRLGRGDLRRPRPPRLALGARRRRGRDGVPTRRSAPPSPEPAARSPRTPRTRCRDRRGRSRARPAGLPEMRSRRRRETAGSGR